MREEDRVAYNTKEQQQREMACNGPPFFLYCEGWIGVGNSLGWWDELFMKLALD